MEFTLDGVEIISGYLEGEAIVGGSDIGWQFPAELIVVQIVGDMCEECFFGAHPIDHLERLIEAEVRGVGFSPETAQHQHIEILQQPPR